MEMINSLRDQILSLGTQVGTTLDVFFMPCLILGAILLLAFARYSYRLLKIVLPVGGLAIGAIVGASMLGSFVEKSFPIVMEYVNPYYFAGIVCAAVLCLLCWKYHTFAILLIGATAGYVVIGRVVKDFLLSLPFINQIANDVIRIKSFITGIIICLICMVISAFLVKRYFKTIYVLATSLFVATATMCVIATILFETTSFGSYATIAGTVLGALIGWSFSYKQLGEVYADF